MKSLKDSYVHLSSRNELLYSKKFLMAFQNSRILPSFWNNQSSLFVRFAYIFSSVLPDIFSLFVGIILTFGCIKYIPPIKHTRGSSGDNNPFNRKNQNDGSTRIYRKKHIGENPPRIFFFYRHTIITLHDQVESTCLSLMTSSLPA